MLFIKAYTRRPRYGAIQLVKSHMRRYPIRRVS